MDTNKNERLIYRVSVNTILLNLLLTGLKLFAGIFGHSFAMISDAIHSGSDVLSTFVVIIGVKLSNKTADKNHPYGHEKFECVAAMLLSLMLGATAVTVGFYGVRTIAEFNKGQVTVPGAVTICFALLSIVVKEWMYCYTKKTADQVKSTALHADAWHHRSDAMSSVCALIGISGAILGFPLLDPIVSLIICVVIIKVSVDIFKTSIAQLIDTSASIAIEDEINEIITSFDEVKCVDMLRTRMFGNKIYVDIEVSLDKNMTFKDAHELVHCLHDRIEDSNADIKHCMIHANPGGEST